ncbi:AAA family ATPase [Chitinophaga sp. SYP-B3965]|uniref:zeta toxin family protein n=1 Tax=Chitinophaga sp. SYP-B3965 TaxID=2663120 RepID=UPI001299618D|nr:zeta toxin family protein [Chitinophaga sp. SYP-B3965]MRG47202.1 AAA family ATPase [Chitinophaga sp. SYP-B3965]
MDYIKPTLLVISGPNGAGKSTHIESMLPVLFEGVLPFDRDLTRTNFEMELRENGLSPEQITERSAKMMENFLISQMDKAIEQQQHFVLETPLSHPDYWRYIDRFESKGYQIQLNYLCLDKVKDCEQRVRQRVKEGGHAVDARTIKGVYEKNLEHINNYFETFKVICLYDGMFKPTLLVKLEDNQIIMAKESSLKKNWIKVGLPSIAKKISEYISAQNKVSKSN